ncbi:thiamine diphosphokinase [uncultured Paracoccus sp.]|uniref:thiamine diphosphokinase n=1 Tax=uncultured Paracoccus sp. TaxID=189685 RepID=UPI0026319D6F|nr:thiamine diphosphokinase [uncultured Paracoccus sp.]
MNPVLTSTRGVTLFGGGEVRAEDAAMALALAPVAMAADSGADAALGLGIVPAAVVGDFDSITDAARAAIPADRLHRVPDQDSTDFDKCLMMLRAPFVLAVGFAGPRTDHLLAGLTTLIRHPVPRAFVIGAEDVIFVAPPVLGLDLLPGTRVSLMPFGAVEGHSTGLRWPIDGLTLTPATRIGTSNEATGPVRLQTTGPCLVILPKDQLRAALDGCGILPD